MSFKRFKDGDLGAAVAYVADGLRGGRIVKIHCPAWVARKISEALGCYFMSIGRVTELYKFYRKRGGDDGDFR